MTAVLGVLLALPGAVLAGFGLYLVTLAAASRMRRADTLKPIDAAKNRLVVLVPAHNEEQLVGRCVESLLNQDYPRDMYRVVVIADNCSDRTASNAESAGADVLIRYEPAALGKGHALRWAIDSLISDPFPPDAVVVVDADSIADPHLLSSLEAKLCGGSPVVQADYSVLVDGNSSSRTRLVAAAFLLFHRVRFSGRARLGMSANLVGNGMLFSRPVLEKHPWNAFTAVEDLENSIEFRLSGIPIKFAPDAHVAGPAASTRTGELRQRLRWEGGRFHVVRTRLPKVIGTAIVRRDLKLLDAALDLATPPLGLLTMTNSFGLAATAMLTLAGVLPLWAAAPWMVAMLAVPVFVVIGLLSADAPRTMWFAIAAAPFYLAWKAATYARLARGFDPNHWGDPDRRDVREPLTARIAGVPIDLVDMPGAVARIRAAVGGASLFQVSTVNLDFLVRAQKDRDIMSIFQRTQMNLADGAPVVWLARLLGVELPGRVAGADLVPALMEELAKSGGRVFLLGGEGGVAGAAAVQLSQRYPGITVAGAHEPPRCAIEDMNNEEILSHITESHADIVLVAFGHPKQERWIDLHRERLGGRVAIGVGCVLDLVAGRSQRAPAWMRAIGLEWAFRLGQEPRRLFARYLSDAAWLVPLAVKTVRARTSPPAFVEPA